MRSVLKEYNFDWRLWSILHYAARITDGSQEEYHHALRFAPNFRDALDMIVSMGEPGVLMLKVIGAYLRNLLDAHAQGRKVALVTYNFNPTVLYALDIMPCTLEALTALEVGVWRLGIHEALDFCCEAGFTETSCTGQRVGLGPVLAGLGVRPDLVMCCTPGVCDSNANSFAFASTYLDLPFFQTDYPATLTDADAVMYQREDFKALIGFLEEQSGKRLDIDRLREVMQEAQRQDELLNELQDLQRLAPCPLPSFYNAMIYVLKMLISGTRECTLIYESMLKAARENAERGIAGNGSETLRGHFFYIDHFAPTFRYWQYLKARGISHLGSMITAFWQAGVYYSTGREEETYRLDLTDYDSMIDSLAAQTSRMPMVKQIRGPYDAPHMWLDDTLAVARIMQPDFLAYIGTMGCRNTWGSVRLISRDMEKAGFPTFISYGDAFDNRVESWDTLQGRLEEFLRIRGLIV